VGKQGLYKLAQALAVATLLSCWAHGALAESPSRAAQLNQEGARLLTLGKHERALSLFEEAARLQPRLPLFQYNIGLALTRLRRLRESLEPLERAKKDAALAHDAGLLRGLNLYELGELEQAAGELEPLRRHPVHGETALYLLVESLRRLGHTHRAQQAFIDLLKAYPDSAYSHKLLGMAYESQNLFDKAIEEFLAALAAAPQMPEIRFALGFAHWKKLEWKDAATWFEQELKIQPCYAPAHYYLGDIAQRGGRTDEAMARFEKALSCEPSHVDALIAQASISEERGDSEMAIQMLKRATKLAPHSVNAHYRLVRVLTTAGRLDEAADHRRVLQELHRIDARPTPPRPDK
jgi:tetratricopeptide (TPR) repeat protein